MSEEVFEDAVELNLMALGTEARRAFLSPEGVVFFYEAWLDLNELLKQVHKDSYLREQFSQAKESHDRRLQIFGPKKYKRRRKPSKLLRGSIEDWLGS